MKQLLTNAILIGLAVAFLVHFCLIAIHGRLFIQEPNRLILWSEIAMMVAFIVLGVTNLLNLFKNLKPGTLKGVGHDK